MAADPFADTRFFCILPVAAAYCRTLDVMGVVNHITPSPLALPWFGGQAMNWMYSAAGLRCTGKRSSGAAGQALLLGKDGQPYLQRHQPQERALDALSRLAG